MLLTDSPIDRPLRLPTHGHNSKIQQQSWPAKKINDNVVIGASARSTDSPLPLPEKSRLEPKRPTDSKTFNRYSLFSPPEHRSASPAWASAPPSALFASNLVGTTVEGISNFFSAVGRVRGAGPTLITLRQNSRSDRGSKTNRFSALIFAPSSLQYPTSLTVKPSVKRDGLGSGWRSGQSVCGASM